MRLREGFAYPKNRCELHRERFSVSSTASQAKGALYVLGIRGGNSDQRGNYPGRLGRRSHEERRSQNEILARQISKGGEDKMSQEKEKLCPLCEKDVKCGEWCAWWIEGNPGVCAIKRIAEMLTDGRSK